MIERDSLGRYIKGRIIPPETLAKMSEAQKGRKHSEETKRKIGEANKKWKHLSGPDNPQWKGGKITKKCLNCNSEYKVSPCRKDITKFCSRSCTGKFYKGKMAAHWKGGKQKLVSGHILVDRPKHPMADKRGRIFEHRLVMEQYLGRYLKPKEVVHHIDGNPENNSIDNLMLFSSNGLHLKYHFAKAIGE